jgi:arylsulfatase A-like enzyme
VLRNGFPVNPDNQMLPELLAGYGFRSAGFVSAFVMSNRFDFGQGFAHYDENFDQLIPEGGIEYLQRSAGSTTDAVIDYLEEAGVPERLFLFVHYFDPHQPYAAPAEFVERYHPAPEELPSDPVERLRALGGTDRVEALQPYARRYAAEISYLDEQVGRLLDHLREAGILDVALLVVTSDHGENFWEHESDELFQHHKWVYQTVVHAPALIRLPGGEDGGTRLGGPTSHIDLLPTILETLQIPVHETIEGAALNLREGTGRPPRLLYGEATGPRWPGGKPHERNARFVREGRFKLIQTPYEGTEELYDLVADPREVENLLTAPTPDEAATAERIRQKLTEWVDAADPLPSTFGGMEKSDTIEKLRSLGYIE